MSQNTAATPSTYAAATRWPATFRSLPNVHNLADGTTLRRKRRGQLRRMKRLSPGLHRTFTVGLQSPMVDSSRLLLGGLLSTQLAAHEHAAPPAPA